MSEVIGTTTYTRERKTVLVAHPTWTPPGQPRGAWRMTRRLDDKPAPGTEVELVRKGGLVESGLWLDDRWHVKAGKYWSAVTGAEFVGWREVLP